MKKRILSLALASAMAVGTVSGAFAETEVTKWANVPYVQGNEAGEFMPNSDITRQEIAVMIGKALELEGSNPDFKDADKIAAWASEFVAGLQDAEIVEGDDAGNFNPTNKITRAELATMVVRAYENATGEELSAGDASFDDVSDSAWYASAVKKAAEAGLVKGNGAGSFNPAGNATRAETVMMINRVLGLGEDNLPSNVAEVLETELNDSDEWPSWAVDAILVASTAFEYTVGEDGKIVIEGEEEDLAVESVSAINATTLEISGTSLGELAKEDITVANNTVSSVTASEDGKSATVKLASLITPNVDTAVTVKVGEETKEFTVKYSLAAETAAITEATYDDNRANQFVAFTVNGASTTVSDLLANGYSVSFSATDEDGTTDKTATLFSNTTTGLLNTAGLIPVGKTSEKYKVQVTISNSTSTIVAPAQVIRITNLDLAASTINSYEFLNTTGGSSVVQNSTKLVVGEKGNFQNLKVVIDGIEEKGIAPTKTESSNKAVASIDAAGVVTAHTPGTTTLSVYYGDVKKDISFTVVNEVRELSSVKVTKKDSTTQIYSTTMIKGTSDYTMSPLDQYGDPMASKVIKIESSDNSVITAPSPATAAANGKVNVTVTGLKAGSASLILKDNSNGKTLSTFGVTVTENAGVATKKLEIVAPVDADTYSKSADNAVDLSDDKVVEYKLKQYNSEGVFNGDVDLTAGPHTATSSDNSVATVVVGQKGDGTVDATTLSITGVKTGTATITVKDSANVVVGTITVTVVDTGISITGASFKTQAKLDYAKTVDYKTFLNYTEAAAGTDPIISGISLSKATNNAVRLNVATGILYLDQDGSATWNAVNDKPIGIVELIETTDSSFANVIAANSIAVASPDEGTLVFSIKEIDTTLLTAKTKVYASTSLNVDIN